VWTIPVLVAVEEGDLWTGATSEREVGTWTAGVLEQPASAIVTTVVPISARRRLGYGELLSEARTSWADCFSILLADIHETALCRLPKSIDIFPACDRERHRVRQFLDQYIGCERCLLVKGPDTRRRPRPVRFPSR
jgi:hypothetical protein